MAQLPAGAGALDSNDDSTASPALDTGAADEALPSGTDGSGLSAAVRHHLEEQVQAAGGSVDQIVSDLRARIDEIDSRPLPEEGPGHQQLQAERALYVAQVSYLEDQLASGARGHRAARAESTDRRSGDVAGRAETDWEESSKAGTAGGAVAGAATGATVGSAGGPVGTVVGGVAGAATGAGVGAGGDAAGVEAREHRATSGEASGTSTGRRRRVHVYDTQG